MNSTMQPERTGRVPVHLALAALSAILVVIGNLTGIAVGDDGVGYQAIADSLNHGHGLTYFLNPHGVTIWPPGWPSLMAIVARVGSISTTDAAVVLNAVTAFAVVLLIDRLLQRLVHNLRVQLLGTAVVAVGGSTMLFGHLLMTDFAFGALMLGLFLALLNFRDSANVGWLLDAVVLVWGAFMVRYAALALIAVGCAWLLVARPVNIARRLGDAVAFGAASMVVPVLWMLRNHSVDGTLLGVRYSSARGLIANMFDTLATVGSFLAPGIDIEQRKLWVLVALVGIAVVGALTWRVVRHDERIRSLRGAGELLGTPLGLLVIQIVGYTLYMLYARTTTGLNRLDFRLLNPIYLPLALFGISIAARVGSRFRRTSAGSPESPESASTQWARLADGTLLAWGALSILLGLAMTAYFLTGPNLFSGNYASSAFDRARSAPVLHTMFDRCDRGPGSLSSNLPNALYDAGIEADWSPRLTGLESNDKVDDIARLEADVTKSRHCIVWFDMEPTYGHLATLDELREHFTLDEVGHDGVVTVYAVEPLGAKVR